MFVFVSTIFVTANLASHTEIIAMLSAGISFRRILFSYFIGAVLLGAFIFVIQGWVLPIANSNRVIFESRYLDDSKKQFRNKHLILDDETYAYASRYEDRQNAAMNFTLEKIKGTQLLQKLYANKAVWQPDSRSWKINNYMVRTYTEEGDKIYYGTNMDTVLNLKPSDFMPSVKKREVLTLGGLNKAIAEIENRKVEKIEPYLVEKYNRYAYPFAIIILTLMAVIVAARKSREGTGFQIFIGFLLAFTFIGAIYVIRLMAEAGDISPLMGAVMPLVTFCVITVFMYRTVPR